MSSRAAGVKAAVERYARGDKSALQALKELGLLSDREPQGRGYVLYKALKHGLDVTALVRYLGWEEFEELIRYVLDELGFNTAFHLRLDCNGGAEFDVVAWSKRLALVVEAKRWRSGRGMWARIACDHLEKVRKCLSRLIAFAPAVVPIVVCATDVSSAPCGVPVVPVWKIGSLLSSFDHLKNHIVVLG
ncbi:MAG: hypothetical protein LM577_02165 [Thermoproteaceae archaeon]|jgi:Holliday junction resolvase-like predicted endonuclease|nr:hypothetical protein [Thermoproteaceae archaeon]